MLHSRMASTLKLPVIVAGHGIDHDNFRKLLERVGFSYTQNIVWGPNEIDVCMWIIDAENWRRQASSLINAVLVRNALGLALSRQHTH